MKILDPNAPVEPKVANATKASFSSTALTTAFVLYLSESFQPVHHFVSTGFGAGLTAILIGVIAGVSTFTVGYISKHLPRELVEDIKDNVPNE